MKEKICNFITKIWGIGAFVLTFLGGATVLGFVVALIIGGTVGTSIAVFLYEVFFPYIIVASSVLVIIGWIRMEIKGELALTAGTKKPKKEKADTK